MKFMALIWRKFLFAKYNGYPLTHMIYFVNEKLFDPSYIG